ncbi:biotin--[acetyl-CoA-carboxylase] ligase [Nocardioides donggukensis]|uniref:biotin--[biotin carboxyl-carrier protein] ligase n=1 Tax=Nocardioides donggukensis TaxID=2774019 RepID=A0A927K6P6_9ACTN|nr:biotin--[acetyl-CoA-carboxylase] ligase [Nocardioides donggukensis]MBD8868705.1 biotin--[acetyl-CoA-carboxylase] ligase [Nocardioides donggukensis]
MSTGPDPRPPLDGSRLPASVEVEGEVASTNAVVAERARAGGPDGLVVVAEHQTAGRGRLDRTWQAPAGTALTFSMLLRPDLPAARWPWIPLWTGYAVHTVLAPRLPGLGLKWPNDVLVESRKLAGILLERVETPTGPAAVVGVGLNVAQTRDELPVPEATSLALELGGAGGAPDRTELLAALVGSLTEHRPLLTRPADLRRAYADVCRTVGSAVRVELPGGGTLTGRAVDVDADGGLVVEGPTGREAVRAGDVVHVRAADL